MKKFKKFVYAVQGTSRVKKEEKEAIHVIDNSLIVGIRKATAFVERNLSSADSLYKHSCNSEETNSTENLISTGKISDIFLSTVDNVHVITTAIVNILTRYEPIVPYRLYGHFLSPINNNVVELIKSLPDSNSELFCVVMTHLAHLISKQSVTKLSVHDISSSVGLLILRPRVNSDSVGHSTGNGTSTDTENFNLSDFNSQSKDNLSNEVHVRHKRFLMLLNHFLPEKDKVSLTPTMVYTPRNSALSSDSIPDRSVKITFPSLDARPDKDELKEMLSQFGNVINVGYKEKLAVILFETSREACECTETGKSIGLKIKYLGSTNIMSEYMRNLRSSSRSPSASDNQLGIAEDRAASRNSNHSGPSLHNNASSRNESNRSSAKGDRMNSERKRNGDMSDSSYGHSDSSKFSQHSKLHRESPLIPPDISSDNEGMYDSPILVSENNENAMEGHIKPVAVKVLPPKVPHDTLNSVEKFNNQQENSHPKRTGIPAIDLAALRADLSVQTIDSSCTEEIVDNETPTDPNSKTNDDHPTVIDPISKLVDSSRSKTHSDNKHRYSKYIQEKELEESKRKHHHPMTREQHVISSSETQEDTASEKVTKNNQKLKQILHTDSAASSDTEDVRKALADKVRQTSLYRRKSSGELFRSLSTESNLDYESYLHEVEVKSPRSDFSNKDEDPLEESYKSLQSTSSIWKSAQPPKGEIIGVYQPALQESSGKDTPEEEHRLLELQSKKRKTTRESFMNDTLESKLQQPLSPNSSHGPRQSMQPSQSQQSLASSDPTEQSERNGLSLTPPGLSLDSPVKQHEKSYSDSATNGSKVVDTLSKNNNSENDQEHQNYLPTSTASTPSAIKKRLIRTISVGSPSDSDGGEGRSLRTESYTDDNFLQEALISTENSIPTQSSGKPLYSPSPIIEETGIRSATTTPDIVVVPHPVNSAINAVIPAASSTLNVDTGHGVITNNVTTQNSGKAGSNARRTSMVGVSVDTAKFLGNNGNNVPTDAYLVILNLKEKLQRLEAVDRARTKEINEIKNDEKVWEKNWMTEIMALRIRNDDLEIENKKLKETLVKMKIDMSNVNAKLAATENAKKSAEMMVDGCYARANREALSTILAQKKLIESLESSVNELKTQANTNQIELLSLNSLYSKTAEELLHWKSVAVQAVSTNKLHREGNNSNALNSSTKNDQESLNEHQNSAHSVSVMHAEVFASSELPATKKDNTNGEGEEPLQSFYTSNINRSSIDKESIADSEAIIHVVAKTPDWSFSPEKKEEFGEERAKFTVSTYKAAVNNEVQQYIANIPNATVQATFEKLLSPIENDNNASSASNRSLAHDISSRGSIDYTFERSNTSHHPVDLYEKHNAAYMLRKSPTQLSGHKENRENAQNVADIKPIENIVEVSTVAVPNAEEEDVDQRHNSKYRKYSEELLAKYFPSKNHARSPLSFGDNVSALNYAGGEINALAGSEYGVQGKSRANGLGLNNRMSTGSASDLYRHYNKPLSSFSATRRVTASSFDFSTRSKLRENLPRNSYVNNLPVERDRLGKDYTGECVSSANRDPNAWYNKKFE